MVSIQSSYTFPSKCRCFSPSRNLVSCSPLTSYLFSLSYPSYGDVICGTSCFYSLNYLSYGDVMYGTFIIYLVVCTIVGTTLITIGIANGSTLPFIILCAFTSMLSCSLFILELEAPTSLTMFFLLTTLLGEFAATFFLFSSVVYISSIVLLTLVDGFYEFSYKQIPKDFCYY